MFRLLVIFMFLCSVFACYGQKDPYLEFNDHIGDLHNQNKHDQAIVLLETIILDKNASARDLFNAYYMKAVTYKRIFNYTESLVNLDIALSYGLKVLDKETITTRISVEKLFLHYDQLEFDKVRQVLDSLKGKDLSSLPPHTHAMYLSVLGSIATKDEQYLKAEQYLDQALEILHAHSQQHLPLIYRKKIDLYRRLNQYDKAVENFEKGLYYAKKHNIDVYILGMYMDMSTFYSRIGDSEKALAYQHKVNELNTSFDNNNRIGKLHQIEKELFNNVQKTQSSRTKLYFILFNALALIGLSWMYYVYRKGYKQGVSIQEKHIEMQQELHKLSMELELTSTPKDTLEQYNFTQRQIQIIELVQQGKTNKEIGAILFVSENTVKYHLKIIFETLGITKRTDLLHF